MKQQEEENAKNMKNIEDNLDSADPWLERKLEVTEDTETTGEDTETTGEATEQSEN